MTTTSSIANDLSALKSRFVGTASHDLLTGTSQGDMLQGRDGQDTLDGGAGNDWLDGGAGSDTYRFGKGYGQDTIVATDPGGGTDTVQFGAGILASGMRYRQSGDDLVLLLQGSADSLTLKYYLAGQQQAAGSSHYRIKLAFANGSVLDPFDLAAATDLPTSSTDSGSGSSSGNGNSSTVNHAPSGSVTITGIPKQGQRLLASHSIQDADGIGKLHYEWLANGQVITGVSGNSFTPTQAQVGQTISARARYVDGQGKAETVTSQATAKIGNANDLPTGTLTLDASPRQGQKLKVKVEISDADGLGNLSYLWLANGKAISKTQAPSYTPNIKDVGKLITVQVSYTDGYGNKESVLSTDSNLVASASSSGTKGKDLLVGGIEGDRLSGGAGNDTLIGGLGQDTLTGGSGADILRFTSLAEMGNASTACDTISDFKRGEDKLDLSQIDADSSTSNDDAFASLVLGSPMSFTQPGQLRFTQGVLYGNVDADADAEFAIALSGISTLSLGDLIL